MTTEFDCPADKLDKAERLDKAMETIVLARGNRNYAFDIMAGLVLQLEERIEKLEESK